MQETILKPKEAAKLLTLSTSTFWKLVRENRIKTIKLSDKRIGVLQSELDSYVERAKEIK